MDNTEIKDATEGYDSLAVPALEILNALGTRPSVLRRHVSMRTPHNAFEGRRNMVAFQSLPQGREATLRFRRRSTDYGEMAVEIPESVFVARNTRRTVRLKDKIDQDQKSKRRGVSVNNNVWENFRDVKWPKLKSRIQVALSYELWKEHMKQVEGNFGTAVVSYFILLRWLFLVNLAIFTLWFSFVCIPQFIWERSARVDVKSQSNLACVFNSSATYNCSNGPPSETVYSIVRPSPGTTYSIRVCQTSNGRLTFQEGKEIIQVCQNSMNCSNGTTWKVCKGNIGPYIPGWYQYVFDFVAGAGIFNQTVLFLGRYANETIINNRYYDLPLATLILTGVVYGITFVLLVFKMGQAYNESYIEFGSDRRVNFCNKVFSLWDYNITDPKAVKLKKIHIKTDLEEELARVQTTEKKLSWSDVAVVAAIRVSTNLLVLLVLVGAGAAIFQTAQWNLKRPSSTNSSSIADTLSGLVEPIVITSFNIILPFLFEFLARVERFKTRGGEIKMTLIRAAMVRVSSLVVVIATNFILISCTQPGGSQESNDQCSLSSLDIFSPTGTNSTLPSTRECNIECWETFIGQNLYKLALTNCVVSACSTFGVETGKRIANNLLYSRIKWNFLRSLFSKGTFNIPQSILDLIYTQLLLWLGFLFSPLQPAIIIITFVVTFFVKKYSLMWNLEPEKRGVFKAARTNFLFLFLLLVSLFSALVPVGYAAARLRPSISCGPFRSKLTMLQIVYDLTDSIKSCNTKLVLSFLQSSIFLLLVIIFLLIVVYSLIVALRARNKKFELIKNQLVLEGGDVTHVIGRVSEVMQRLMEQRKQALEVQPTDTKERKRKRSSAPINQVNPPIKFKPRRTSTSAAECQF